MGLLHIQWKYIKKDEQQPINLKIKQNKQTRKLFYIERLFPSLQFLGHTAQEND